MTAPATSTAAASKATTLSKPETDRVPQFDSFESFWPYYLAQHRHPATRACHFVGTTAAMASGIAGIATGNPLFFAAMPLLGYGFAWGSHFLIEHNQPATFHWPVYSLEADVKMYTSMARGQLWSGDPGPWTPPPPQP